jgi:hypothetical protein
MNEFEEAMTAVLDYGMNVIDNLSAEQLEAIRNVFDK